MFEFILKPKRFDDTFAFPQGFLNLQDELSRRCVWYGAPFVHSDFRIENLHVGSDRETDWRSGLYFTFHPNFVTRAQPRPQALCELIQRAGDSSKNHVEDLLDEELSAALALET